MKKIIVDNIILRYQLLSLHNKPISSNYYIFTYHEKKITDILTNTISTIIFLFIKVIILLL